MDVPPSVLLISKIARQGNNIVKSVDGTERDKTDVILFATATKL